LSEVSDTFGAFTFRPNVALGSWTAGGMRYDDRLFLLSTDRRLTTTRAVNGRKIRHDHAVRTPGRIDVHHRPAL